MAERPAELGMSSKFMPSVQVSSVGTAMVAARAEIFPTSSFCLALTCVRFAATMLVGISRKPSTSRTQRIK